MNSDKTGESRLKPRSVELLREPVELYKVLKFEGLVASGGGVGVMLVAVVVAVVPRPAQRPAMPRSK